MAWYLMFNFSMRHNWHVSTSYGFIKLEDVPEINNSEVYEKAVVTARNMWLSAQASCEDSICSIYNPELVWRELLEVEKEKEESMAEALLIPHKQREFEKRRETLVHDPDCTAEQ